MFKPRTECHPNATPLVKAALKKAGSMLALKNICKAAPATVANWVNGRTEPTIAYRRILWLYVKSPDSNDVNLVKELSDPLADALIRSDEKETEHDR